MNFLHYILISNDLADLYAKYDKALWNAAANKYRSVH